MHYDDLLAMNIIDMGHGIMFEDNDYSEMTFCDLKCVGTDISGKEFLECTFKNSVFENVMFRNCIFERCVFDSCSLILPGIGHSTFDDVHFQECKIAGLNFGDLNTFSISLGFDRSKLLSCSFVGLELKSTSFSNSQIVDTVFRECNLQKTDFEGVLFTSTIFSRNDLTHANFKDASGFFINPCDNKLKGATFSHTSALELLHQFGINFI